MTVNQPIPKIYDTRFHDNTNQRFITCYFKIAYTIHTKTYDISATHTIEEFINKMKQQIRNDLYLELSEASDFEFVNAYHYSIDGVASEQGPALQTSRQHTLLSLCPENTADDLFLAFYIRPQHQDIINNNNT